MLQQQKLLLRERRVHYSQESRTPTLQMWSLVYAKEPIKIHTFMECRRALIALNLGGCFIVTLNCTDRHIA